MAGTKAMRASDRNFQAERLTWRDEPLAEILLPDGPLAVTLGLGSGLARGASDPPDMFWAIGDRGPNLKVGEAVRRHRLDHFRPLLDLDGAKIMPCLDVGPTLVSLRIDGNVVTALYANRLRSAGGRLLSGLPPSAGPGEETEPIFSLACEALGTDPSGVDSEALVALADGNFWIADEYGPSLLKVDRNGEVAVRWVPVGTERMYRGTDYPVEPLLPAIAAKRRLNRGFEALALSPDETWLYAIFQSPLAHPDRAAHARGRHVRVWKIDAGSGAIAAEYLYPLDPPSAFRRDLAAGPVEPGDIKVSEALMLGENSLLVLERISASTKFYRVDLGPGHEVPGIFRDPATRPTVEQMDDAAIAAAGIAPLAKTLILDTDDAPEICADLEGMVLLAPDTLLLVNDNDFGVAGVATEFWRVTFDRNLTAA